MRNPTVLVYLGKEVDSKKVGRSWLLQTFTKIHAQQEGNSKTPYLCRFVLPVLNVLNVCINCTTDSLPTGSWANMDHFGVIIHMYFSPLLILQIDI
jgi:hypothetical protein